VKRTTKKTTAKRPVGKAKAPTSRTSKSARSR
jgi:hypothetical protein